MLRAAAEGIKARGKSDLGDKTLLDALIPMTDALEQRVAAGEPAPAAAELAGLAATTARTAADATTPMRAKRGRQSYTGERSIGSPDPASSTSTSLPAFRAGGPCEVLLPSGAQGRGLRAAGTDLLVRAYDHCEGPDVG